MKHPTQILEQKEKKMKYITQKILILSFLLGALVVGIYMQIGTTHTSAATTPVESAGTPIGGIITYFDNDPRNATTLDIDADKGIYLLLR